MNKRIKKKKQKAAYKIPKYVLRLTKKWTHLDDSMLYWSAFSPQKEHHVPKKMMINFIRKYRRIHFFLNDLEDQEIFRSGFFISREAYGIIQYDGEFCDQTGGYTGDDFEGMYYYPIGNGRYFGYRYEC